MTITAAELRQILDYDPETGVFRWKTPLNARFKVGAQAGTPTHFGYRAIQLFGKKHYLHRLAWLYVYGEWPAKQVDHIDRCKSNNAILNLREATPSQNRVNAYARVDSKTGVRGVSFHKAAQKFAVDMWCGGQHHYFGLFETIDDAIVVRDREAANLHGIFHCPAIERTPAPSCAINVEK